MSPTSYRTAPPRVVGSTTLRVARGTDNPRQRAPRGRRGAPKGGPVRRPVHDGEHFERGTCAAGEVRPVVAESRSTDRHSPRGAVHERTVAAPPKTINDATLPA